MEDLQYHNTNIKNIIDHLGSCFPGNSDNFSDVMLTCSDGQIYAHKIVLASISQMLYTELKQNIWDEIVSIIVPDYSLQEVTKYLKSIYTCQDMGTLSIFDKIIGSIETKEIEAANDRIFRDIENVNVIALNKEEIFSSHEDMNCEVKVKVIDVVKKNRGGNEWTINKAKRKFLRNYFKVNPDDMKKVYCSICSRQYSYDFIIKRTIPLLDHLYTHGILREINNRTRSWKCPKCSRVFIDEEKMNSHILRQHSEVLPCAYCGKIIGNRQARIRHEKEHRDKEERIFSCDLCTKAFINMQSLRRHNMIHNGEMPYQCSDCGKRFRQSNGLKEHQKHHTGETPYECSRCFRKFKFKQVFDKHKCTPQIN